MNPEKRKHVNSRGILDYPTKKRHVEEDRCEEIVDNKQVKSEIQMINLENLNNSSDICYTKKDCLDNDKNDLQSSIRDSCKKYCDTSSNTSSNEGFQDKNIVQDDFEFSEITILKEINKCDASLEKTEVKPKISNSYSNVSDAQNDCSDPAEKNKNGLESSVNESSGECHYSIPSCSEKESLQYINVVPDVLEFEEITIVKELINEKHDFNSKTAKVKLERSNSSDIDKIKNKCSYEEGKNENDLETSECDAIPNISSDVLGIGNKNIVRDDLEFKEITILNEMINKKYSSSLEMPQVKQEISASCFNTNDAQNYCTDPEENNKNGLESSVNESSGECHYSIPSSEKECLRYKNVVADDLEFEEITIEKEFINEKQDFNTNSSDINKIKNKCSYQEGNNKSDLQDSVNDEVVILEEFVVNDFKTRPTGAKEESPYYCKDCDVSATSLQTLEAHMHGKKHKKKIQSQMPDAVEEIFPGFETKYVSSPVEHRWYEEDTALVQKAAETLKNPCPALNYLTEIQGLNEASYWCKLCHAMYYLHEVLSHLNDFKHKLKCLKLYDFDAYKRIRLLDKSEAEYRLPKVLKGIIRQYGFGKITVEKRALDDSNQLTSYNRQERRWDNSNQLTSYNRQERRWGNSNWRFNNQDTYYKFGSKFLDRRNPRAFNPGFSSRRGLSYEEPDYKFRGKFFERSNRGAFGNNHYSRRSSLYKESEYESPSTEFISPPDPYTSDFYCKNCDAHMNNDSMWESHIRGSRHIRNCKKESGELPSRLKSVKVPNARAKLMDQIDEISEPVVGLDAIEETHDVDLLLYKYKCFLCGSSSTPLDIIDHILSVKHRENFLKKIEYAPFEDATTLNISDWNRESLISEMCANIEAERGRGNIEVRTTDVNYQLDHKQHDSGYV